MLAETEVTVAVVSCLFHNSGYKNSDLLVAVRLRFTLSASLVPDQEHPTPPTSRQQFCQTRMKWMMILIV